MKLSNLKPAVGSAYSHRCISRGSGSGLGGTSTHGREGTKPYSGYKRKIDFEDGQMPLQRRAPKTGSENINRKEYLIVNLSTLQALAEKNNLTKIGVERPKTAGFTNGKEFVRVLGNGELEAKLGISTDALSKTAEEAIKAAGGNTAII